ncbi:hypothetical protein GCM10023205_71290 [Yinghuangia aomiensis]|uniref:Uncharacterized protein n=1 Tax=Yinghuangia aomiensis TaxID=676205 RepID=A0ABP9I6X6_9ACTN
MAAHRAAAPEKQIAPAVRAAIERQDRDLASHREPEAAFRAVLARQDQDAGQTGPGRGSDAYLRARQQAARDRAARNLPTITTAPAAAQAPLRDTA